MKKFEFNKDSKDLVPVIPFYGYSFYEVYKYAHFLQDRDNVHTILNEGYQLRQMLKEVAPGEKVAVSGMWLTEKTPLVVIKGGTKAIIGSHQFTVNRLTGITAAYVFENRKHYSTLVTSESTLLGLRWDCKDIQTSRLYLSAVSGSEHFYDQFSFWPLLCALKKLEMKKITLDPVVKMARIKNKNGIPMGVDMMNHKITTVDLWGKFKARSDFRQMIKQLPKELELLLSNK